MNFFPNMPNFDGMNPGMNNQMSNTMGNLIENPMMMSNDLFYKMNDIENRIKRLEQRIARLESEKGNNYYSEPDTLMYMI